MYKAGGYEAHMTFDKQYAKEVEHYSQDMTGFVYSVITGCPLLGQGTYCYLTAYDRSDPDTLVEQMNLASKHLSNKGVPTLRSKVEHIVYDTKTGVNELANVD